MVLVGASVSRTWQWSTQFLRRQRGIAPTQLPADSTAPFSPGTAHIRTKWTHLELLISVFHCRLNLLCEVDHSSYMFLGVHIESTSLNDLADPRNDGRRNHRCNEISVWTELPLLLLFTSVVFCNWPRIFIEALIPFETVEALRILSL